MSTLISNWTVDYGDGPRAVTVPHAWKQDVPVTWEGPAVYRTRIEPKSPDSWLLFHGVSYQAKVKFNGVPVAEHRGIWDAWAVRLAGYEGTTVDVEVEVVKNGGQTFPVRDVLSGFLPYVFNPFGGIHDAVEIVEFHEDPSMYVAGDFDGSVPCRLSIDGSHLLLDGKPFQMRAALTWGWYPELGHTHAPIETIRKEVRLAKSMGFNAFKFCLWAPPHRFLDVMEEEGMVAWLELPLWDPSDDPVKLKEMAGEMLRIARQYAAHRNIIAWTVGCELSTATPAAYRAQLVEEVKAISLCPLVKDNSGGAEMYGGDLREYGSFYDYHPYCDTQFYPAVFATLMPGPRKSMPVLLGEFNDFDVHRDLNAIAAANPYWSSDSSDLNDIGVRWQMDIPRLVRETRFCKPGTTEMNEALRRRSIVKGSFVRRKVFEAVRSFSDIAGYAITGWRHTPISTSGMVDDEMRPVYSEADTDRWNGPDILFTIPVRRPPWVPEGNRPGYRDVQCYFAGQAFVKLGGESVKGYNGPLRWRVSGVADGVENVSLRPCEPGELVQISAELKPGAYDLVAEMGDYRATWPLWVVDKPDWKTFEGWRLHDPLRLTECKPQALKFPGGKNVVATAWDPVFLDDLKAGGKVVLLLNAEGTTLAPFWRECIQEFLPTGDAACDRFVELFADRWERLYPVAADSVIDMEWLKARVPAEYQTVVNRVDTRTYRESAYMVRAKVGDGELLVTTLRPYGGLGVQPTSLGQNPAGCALLATLVGR